VNKHCLHTLEEIRTGNTWRRALICCWCSKRFCNKGKAIITLPGHGVFYKTDSIRWEKVPYDRCLGTKIPVDESADTQWEQLALKLGWKPPIDWETPIQDD